MDLPSVVLEDLAELLDSIGSSPSVLQDPLAALVSDLKLAVRSFLGVQIVVVRDAQPVTVTSFEPLLSYEEVATSLRMELDEFGTTGLATSVVFFAGNPGAFVDLAADLRVVPHREGSGLAVTLDANSPSTLASGLLGLTTWSRFDRAVGTLIEQGHLPHEAERRVRARDATAGEAGQPRPDADRSSPS